MIKQVYLFLFFHRKKQNLEIIAKNESMMDRMLKNFASVHSGYTPTPWCFPATLNTCAYIKVQLNGELNYERELLETPDGGVVGKQS